MKSTYGIYFILYPSSCRSQWPRGLRSRSATARLLRSWVRIPLGALMSVCCECCVLSGRGLCDGLVTRPEESYRLCCVGCVWSRKKTREWGGHSPRNWVAAPIKKNLIFEAASFHWSVSNLVSGHNNIPTLKLDNLPLAFYFCLHRPKLTTELNK